MSVRWPIYLLALYLMGCADELTTLKFSQPGQEKTATVRVTKGDNIELWNDIHIVREGDGESSIFWEIAPSLNGKALEALKCDPYLSNYCASKSDGRNGKEFGNCFIEGCDIDIDEAGQLEVRAKIAGSGTGGKVVRSHTLRIKRD